MKKNWMWLRKIYLKSSFAGSLALARQETKEEEKILNRHKKSWNLWTYFWNFYIYIFCSLTNRQTDEIFIEYMLIHQINLHKKYQDFIVNSTKKFTFLLGMSIRNRIRNPNPTPFLDKKHNPNPYPNPQFILRIRIVFF